MHDVAALFFAAQFFCVDNVPRPQALAYFGTAFAYCIDAGFHRWVRVGLRGDIASQRGHAVCGGSVPPPVTN